MQKHKFLSKLDNLFLTLCCLFVLSACGQSADTAQTVDKSGITVCNGWNIQSGSKDCPQVNTQLTVQESAVTPTYTLVRTPAAGSITEGGQVTIELKTTNLKNRTVVPFTITGAGISVQDIQTMTLNGVTVPPSLSNSFVIGNQGTANQASLVLTFRADTVIEGTETLTLALNNVPSVSVSVNIVDAGTTTTGDSVAPTISVTNQGSINSSSVIPISGSATDNVAVSSVTWSNSLGGSGTASISGTTSATWTANVSLKVGSNIITFVASDAAGNTATTTTTVNLVDTTAPVITVTNQGAVNSSGAVTISGSVTDNVAVSSVTWSNSLGGSGTVSISGTSWTANLSLAVGSNVITFSARDTANNISTTSVTITRTLTSDITPPTVTITQQGTVSATGIVTIYGTVTDNVAVSSLTWSNSATGKRGTGTIYNGTWTANIPLNLGSNPLTITATDSSGNQSSVNTTVTRADTRVPAIAIISQTTPDTNGLISVNGSASDNVSVTSVLWSNSLGGSGSATLSIPSGGPNVTWSVNGIQLSTGDNVITFTASDSSGNRSTRQITVNRPLPADTVSPTITIGTPGTPNSTGLLVITGSASDNVAVTSVTWSNSLGGTGTAVVTGTTSAGWTANVQLAVGSNVITFTARDAANNQTSSSVTVTRDPPPDATSPTITIGTPGTPDSTGISVIAGTASDNIAVTSVTWSNSLGGTGTAVVTGTANATWTANVQLAVGSNVITFTVKDAANNQNSSSVTVTRDPPPDATAPNIVIGSQGTPDATGKVTISGTASDNSTVTGVTWINSTGGSGTATLTSFGNVVTWTASNIQLVSGSNTITFTAQDSSNNNGTVSTVVQYVPPPPPDTTAPTIAITSYSAMDSNGYITVNGTATDNVGVQSIAWTNSLGGTGGGTVTGTTNATWYTSQIQLKPGANVITFRVTDTSANGTTIQMTFDGATGTGNTSFVQANAKPPKVKPNVAPEIKLSQSPNNESVPKETVPAQSPRPPGYHPGPDPRGYPPGYYPGYDPRGYPQALFTPDDLIPRNMGENVEQIVELNLPEPPNELHPCKMGLNLQIQRTPYPIMAAENRYQGWWLLASYIGYERDRAAPPNFINLRQINKPNNTEIAYFYWARQLSEVEIGIVPTGFSTADLIKNGSPGNVKIETEFTVLPYQWLGIMRAGTLPVDEEEKCSFAQ